MTGMRSPGRYNLHRLGWAAFEDLCAQIMRVELGETFSRYRPGADGGRDGWFQGKAEGTLATKIGLVGNFVLQCKHTSRAHLPLDVQALKAEVEKVRQLAVNGSINYVLMTNRQVTAPAEALIRDTIEAVPGVARCLVLAETWIEDTVDAHPRLLRLVPRLYGIGDLSQIVAFVVQEQTRAVLEDLAVPLRTFVPTESYRRAERSLHDHRFVVLVGPPASGKSAIAANLCLVHLAQDPNVRVLRIEQADQFKSTWSPADPDTVYWVDDVFGETTLDEERMREWAAALDKVEAARRRGARIIFCTRDYILSAAERRLKSIKVEMINDARVRVDVQSLTEDERECILYNHVKDGDIPRATKTALKRYLPRLSRHRAFSPELARRLGSKRFHDSLVCTAKALDDFFESPVRHFRDVIRGLSNPEAAALAACLLSGNALQELGPEDEIALALLHSYGVSVHAVREALETLEGSLVKRVRQETTQTWQLHHPSMIEALQAELAERPSQLTLYLKGAKLGTLLRDTSTTAESCAALAGRIVFVPDTAYVHLVPRLIGPPEAQLGEVARYLAGRASSRLLHAIEEADPALLDRAMALAPEPEGGDPAAELAVRLSKEPDLFNAHRRASVEAALRSGAEETGCCTFLDVAGLPEALPGFVEQFVQAEVESGFESVWCLLDWYAQDFSSSAQVNSAASSLYAHLARLEAACGCCVQPQAPVEQQLRYLEAQLEQRLGEHLSELEEAEEARAESMEDYLVEQHREAPADLGSGRFRDVDE
jgi:hypothetical protein